MITRRSILTIEEIVFVNLGSEGEPEPRLLQGAELVLQRHARRREISQAPVLVMGHAADLLKRLEYA